MDDKQEGFGEEKWPDGTCYQGSYNQGLKEGHGTFVWPDGSRYDGEFKGNNI